MTLTGLVAIVPPKGPARALATVSLVDAVGSGFFLAGSAVFFLRVLELSVAQVGVGLALANLIGFLTTVPLGMLADRVGARRMLVALQLWRATWMAALPFADSMPAFVLVATLITVADCGVMPLTRSLVSAAVGTGDRTRTLGFMRSWRNAGFAVGAALTAPLITLDSHAAYAAIILINAASYLFAAVVIARLPLSAPASSTRRPSIGGLFPAALRDGPYVALTALDAALTMHVTLLAIGVPLWITSSTSVPAAAIPALVVVNTLLAVALQVRFASQGESTAAGRRALQRAGGCLAIGCFLLAWTRDASALAAAGLIVVAVVAFTAAELWNAAGSWALSYRFARPERETEYLSVFSLAAIAEAVVAPLVLTTAVIGGPWFAWGLLGVTFLGVTLAVRPVVGLLERSRTATAAEPSTRPVGPTAEKKGLPRVATVRDVP